MNNLEAIIMNPKISYAIIALRKNIFFIICCMAIAFNYDIWWLLILTIIYAAFSFYKFHFLLSFSYKVTNEQIIIQYGVFGKAINFIELYRVKDISIQQTFLDRIFNLANITIVSFDAAEPMLIMKGIKNVPEFPGFLREIINLSRRKHNVFSLEK